jgi:hypothetical protein
VEVPAAKLPQLPIPRRLMEKMDRHQSFQQSRPNTSASPAAGAWGTSASADDHHRPGDEFFQKQMEQVAAGLDGFPAPVRRTLNPSSGGTGTRPTTSGEMARGRSMISSAVTASSDSLASLYITRRRSPPRGVDARGMAWHILPDTSNGQSTHDSMARNRFD